MDRGRDREEPPAVHLTGEGGQAGRQAQLGSGHCPLLCPHVGRGLLAPVEARTIYRRDTLALPGGLDLPHPGPLVSAPGGPAAALLLPYV